MTAESPTKAGKPKRIRPKAKRPQTAKVGAKLQPQTAERLEFVYECLAGRMRRMHVFSALRQEVDRRIQVRAEAQREWKIWTEAGGEKSGLEKPRHPDEVMPEHRLWKMPSASTVDDLIRGARERMAADTSPGRQREVKAEIVSLLRTVQRRLLSGTRSEAPNPLAAARVAMDEAKLHGLIIERHKVEAGLKAPDDLKDLTDEQLADIATGG